MAIIAYTDGGCSGNPGPGAWAFILNREGERLDGSGRVEATTNNRMELTAVIKALEALQGHPVWRGLPVDVHTDSQYVQKGITQWVVSWVRNGWKTTARKPVKNQDLWKDLLSLTEALTVSWHWVKGHDGDPLNEACDSMVRNKLGI